jgi:hypothetical protein
MSASSVPTIETSLFIETFPHQVLPVQGVPVYEALNEVKTLLKANAASVPSNRGGGANGYLSVVVSALSSMPPSITNSLLFHQTPAHIPSVLLAPQPPSSGKQCANMPNKQLREWREYTNIQGALHKQLVTVIEPIYLHARRDRHIGFNNAALRELLAFLFDTYGQITPQDLQSNQQRMLTP